MRSNCPPLSEVCEGRESHALSLSLKWKNSICVPCQLACFLNSWKTKVSREMAKQGSVCCKRLCVRSEQF